MKRIMISSLLVAALSGLTAQQAVGAEPSVRACPLGWNNPGPVTVEEFIDLDHLQAARDAGLSTIEGERAFFAEENVNGDMYLCVKEIPPSGSTPNPASEWQYWYLVRDNNGGPAADA